MKSPPRPSRVKVGAHHYRIEAVPATSIKGCVGECMSGSEKRIRVRNNLKGIYLAETLLHEIMHAVWYEWGIKNSEMTDANFAAGVATEEQAINGLANGLTAVFRDNPAFERWYFHHTHSQPAESP